MKLYIASASALPHLETVERLIRDVRRMTRPTAHGDDSHVHAHVITHDWTAEVRKHGAGSPDDSEARVIAAIADLAAVRAADLVWLVAPPADSRSTGAWVELGAALALGIPVMVSGDARRCIFADLAAFTFETHEEALDFLRRN